MNASALSPRERGSDEGCSTSGAPKDCSMKLPAQQSLTLAQVPTAQLRTLAAFAGLDSVDAVRPALLGSLRHALSKEGKQQWVVHDAQVSVCHSGL